ncbi:MAG: heparan-alpha-glucosaminide N-acetyltransferase [Bacteriovoracaceae bacterium]
MRVSYLDTLRGMAVSWMIIFHTTYDMNMLGMIELNFNQGFWYAFPRVIAFTFLFCVGVSLNFTHKNHIKWQQLKLRSIKLGLAAFSISLVTYFLFPQQWIFFGTLHCILTGSILGAFLVNQRKLALILLIGIIFSQYVLHFDIKWVSSIVQRPSMDFIPIYPWFWAILLGIVAGPYLNEFGLLQRIKGPQWAAYLGKHSLKIYLLHQPLIYGVLFLIKSLL